MVIAGYRSDGTRYPSGWGTTIIYSKKNLQASKLRSDRVTHQLVKSVATNVAKKVHNQIIYNREIYCQTILLG